MRIAFLLGPLSLLMTVTMGCQEVGDKKAASAHLLRVAAAADLKFALQDLVHDFAGDTRRFAWR